MSQENVEILRALYEAWNARNMDAFPEMYDLDAMIVRGLEGWPESDPFVGREAIIGYFKQLRETWDSDTLEPIGDFAVVGARVAVRQLWRGEGRGPDLNMEFTAIYTFRKGKIFLIEFFWDHAEALETLGLSE
jgi:ketosteroid isomerase-like protein